MKRYRLGPTHPAAIAFDNLCLYMEENGIYITLCQSAPYYFTHDGVEYMVLDVESSDQVDELPPSFEYKLCYNSED